jgi:Putative prokaryotic signal transducing protein
MASENWVHLATAPDQITAEIWVSLLQDNGISAFIRPSDVPSYLGVSALGCRVQVREDDLEKARSVIGPDEA